MHIEHVGTIYEWKDTENKLTDLFNTKLLPFSNSKIKSLSSPQQIKTIGPSLPPSFTNQSNGEDNDNNSDSDEDDIGPALPGEERLPSQDAIESLKREINEQKNPTVFVIYYYYLSLCCLENDQS